jgi:Transglutaminase-like superfamily
MVRTFKTFLAPHAYVCLTERGAIILDVQRDEYLGVDSTQSAAMAHCISDWPVEAARTNPSELPADVRKLLERLKRLGILVDTPPDTRKIPPILAAPENEIDGFLNRHKAPIELRHVLQFVLAWATAVVISRTLPFRSIIRRVERRRARPPSAISPEVISTAQTAALRFYRLRAFFYTARKRCLFDSLVLLEFFALQKIHASWVFGVATHGEFSAHCWVQTDKFVLNGTAEYCRGFRIITVF